jgi:hypothetical protein
MSMQSRLGPKKLFHRLGMGDLDPGSLQDIQGGLMQLGDLILTDDLQTGFEIEFVGDHSHDGFAYCQLRPGRRSCKAMACYLRSRPLRNKTWEYRCLIFPPDQYFSEIKLYHRLVYWVIKYELNRSVNR